MTQKCYEFLWGYLHNFDKRFCNTSPQIFARMGRNGEVFTCFRVAKDHVTAMRRFMNVPKSLGNGSEIPRFEHREVRHRHPKKRAFAYQ